MFCSCFGLLLSAFAVAHAQNASPVGDFAVPAGTLTSCPVPGAQLHDMTFHSQVLGETRHFRIFLPAKYNSVSKRYPVIYYMHGHSDRYTLEDYDQGHDTVPKICRFVAAHPVIVVAVDGFIAKNYTGFYGGSPYDIQLQTGNVDFGPYFLEQVRYIDAHYRTLADRRYRATSGLSMGGFMSLYLASRYPETIGSCSAFNPGPEFYVGDEGRRSLWRPKDFVSTFEHTPVRLIRASGDYISQYTEETHAAFAAAPKVDFEFRQDEYPRHWATSIGETFDFHMRAFADSTLATVPQRWDYASPFDTFDVWGYHVSADIAGPAFIYMTRVSKGGLLLKTRRWAPDGPAAVCTRIDVATAPLYKPGVPYQMVDYNLSANATTNRKLVADSQGRLHVQTDCSGHEFGFAGPGIEAQPVVLLPLTAEDFLRLMPGKPLSIPVRLWNPGPTAIKNLQVDLTSEYPTVKILNGTASVPELGVGQLANLGSSMRVQFTAGAGDFARTRLQLNASAQNGPPMQADTDVMVAPADLGPPEKIEVLDGRTHTFQTFFQGVHGGGESLPRTVTEGKGNGDSALDPGEQATVWIQLAQGMDPFDKNNWCRTKVYSNSPWITEVADIQEQKGREWTGAKNRTSVIELNPKTPKGTEISAILDCEAYSYAFTPDVRYGKLPLYQPYQFHRHYLFLWKWKVGGLPDQRPK